MIQAFLNHGKDTPSEPPEPDHGYSDADQGNSESDNHGRHLLLLKHNPRAGLATLAIRESAPIDRHMTARKSGRTSGLPRLAQRPSRFLSARRHLAARQTI